MKLPGLLASAVSALLSVGHVHLNADTPDWQEACLATAQNYAFIRDFGPAEDVKTIFTKDAVVTLPGTTMSGLDAITARTRKVLSTQVSQHHITSQKFATSATGTMTGRSYLIASIRPKNSEGLTPKRVLQAVYEDEYEIVDGACMIAKRTARPLFSVTEN